MKKLISQLVLCSVLASGGVALARAPRPATNVSAKLHPNLAAAQRLISAAFVKITAAQKANEFDLGGPCAESQGAPGSGQRRAQACRRDRKPEQVTLTT